MGSKSRRFQKRAQDLHTEGMSHAEIAGELGIHRNTVAKYVRQRDTRGRSVTPNAAARPALTTSAGVTTVRPIRGLYESPEAAWRDACDAHLRAKIALLEAEIAEMKAHAAWMADLAKPGSVNHAG